jgi:polyisoprenyl-phosphate glycosyltransferase
LDLATGDAVIFMDTDLQHPPELLPALIEKWRQGASVVLAKRRSRETDIWPNKYVATAFYRMHNRISEITIPIDTGDFGLIDRDVANNLKTLRESRRFLKGLVAWVGYDAEIVEYDVVPRVYGKSSFNKWQYWNFALEGITSFSTVPLRLWTYFGMAMTGVSFLYVAAIIIRALAFGIDVPGYITVISAVTFFGGLQLIGIGILGEYIGRIYIEAKRRPPYLIKKMIR